MRERCGFVLLALLLAGCDRSLEAKCRRGDGQACGVLGDRLYHGAAPGQDLAPACDYYRRACDHGNDVGCANLGSLLAHKRCAGGAVEALKVLERACDHGHAVGCNNLGTLLRDGGEGVPADRERARKLYTTACDRSVGESCYQLGLLDFRPPEPAGASRAAPLFAKACDLGVAGACNNLGLMHAQGIGVPLDAARAAALLQKACDGGELRACANVGSRYLTGDGVAKDERRGRELIVRACKGGVAEACQPPAR